MSKKIVNIARNTSYYTLALVVQKVISFSYFVIIAHALGPDDLGRYYFAISFTTIFAILIDLGLSNVLTREAAKDNTQAQKYLGNIIGLKLPLAFFALLAVLAASHLLGYDNELRVLIIISAVSMILDSFTLSFWAVLRGFHNLRYESLSAIIFQAIVLSSGLLALWHDFRLSWLIGALALASAYNFIYSFWSVKRLLGLSLSPRFDVGFLKRLLVVVAPFAAFAILQRFYTYFDAVMLQRLAGDRSVGIYQVAFKIINALQFLPMAFSASLYPAFSAYWQDNRGQLAITFERSMNYLLLISAPITVGVLATADKIILLFSQEYQEAVLPLQINMLALSFIFLNFAIGALLNACDRQKYNTWVMAATATLSVIINFLLIPRLGALGATITVAITSAFAFFAGLAAIPAITAYDYRKVVSNSAKIIIAALLMGLAAYWLKAYLNIFLVVPSAGLAYFYLLLRFGVLRLQDIMSIAASFRKKKIDLN